MGFRAPTAALVGREAQNRPPLLEMSPGSRQAGPGRPTPSGRCPQEAPGRGGGAQPEARAPRGVTQASRERLQKGHPSVPHRLQHVTNLNSRCRWRIRAILFPWELLRFSLIYTSTFLPEGFKGDLESSRRDHSDRDQ